ncbi:unnamed protein product, partial [Symbiodinium sp. KB8]
MEAQAADKRCWELIAELVNLHNWKLDDALHELSEVRSDMSSLLAPRAFIHKRFLEPADPWRGQRVAKGNPKGGGRGQKGREGKGEKGERTERGGKGGKGKDNKNPTQPGKWLSTLFMEGKRHTLCMRYQNGQCKAMMEGSLTFSTCLELLEEHFSKPCLQASYNDSAVSYEDAYFNLGAFSFESGSSYSKSTRLPAGTLGEQVDLLAAEGLDMLSDATYDSLLRTPEFLNGVPGNNAAQQASLVNIPACTVGQVLVNTGTATHLWQDFRMGEGSTLSLIGQMAPVTRRLQQHVAEQKETPLFTEA